MSYALALSDAVVPSRAPVLNRLYLRTPPVYGQSYFAIAQTIAPYTFPRSYSRKMLDIFQFAYMCGLRPCIKRRGCTFEGTDFKQVVPSDAACVWAVLFRYRSNDCSIHIPPKLQSQNAGHFPVCSQYLQKKRVTPFASNLQYLTFKRA